MLAGVLLSSESVQDLDVACDTKLTYEEHCVNIIRRANFSCSHFLRTYASRNSSFMAKVFMAYIWPIIENTFQVWSLSTVNLMNRVEHVQRLFTKLIRSVANLPYNERLKNLGLRKLKSSRLHLDILF